MTATVSELRPWTPSVAEGRWCGFGPYYAMFPVHFAREAIDRFCPARGGVIDPFCGRGTTSFVSQLSGRPSLASDLNPVAWIFAKTKTDPYPNKIGLWNRVVQLLDLVCTEDRVAENEFQKLAWSAEVLGFLNAARRNLDWRRNKLDRTLMALILIHLHGKLGEGLSNQMRQAKAMAPDYSVRWWQGQSLSPPQIDVRRFFARKLDWRYAKGIPKPRADARVYLGDCRKTLRKIEGFNAKMIITSPPYYGLTNYSYDNWIRLWMLGGPSLPDSSSRERYGNQVRYRDLIEESLGECRSLSADNVTVLLRTSAQEFSKEIAIQAIKDTWPEHRLFLKFDKASGPTQTALYGHKWTKRGEVDLLALSGRKRPPEGFFKV
nr:hypothetical protein [uncultured Hyphomonas sp.]